MLGTLGVSLLGSLLTGRGVITKRQGRWNYTVGKGKGEGIVRTGYGNDSSKMDF